MSDSMKNTAGREARIWVAGASGFVGREIVLQAAARGDTVVAHLRQDSTQRERLAPIFSDAGARVSVAPWDFDALQQELAEYKPTAVFYAIGTTRARAQRESIGGNIYAEVDVRLCEMLAKATAAASPNARFVLLSSIGAKHSNSAYLNARIQMEEAVQRAGLAATVFRPSLITGDRDEFRLGEVSAAAVSKVVLGAIGLFAPSFQRQYAPIGPRALGQQMLAAADDKEPWRIVEASSLSREVQEVSPHVHA